MSKYNFFCILTTLILFEGISQAQLSEYGVPYSFSGHLKLLSSYISLPPFNSDSIVKNDEKLRQQGYKDNRFAKMIPVDITPFNAGTWDRTDEGRVWRVGIRSENAYSLYMVFNKFNLTNGCKLYIYDPAGSEVRGAFTTRNNNKAKILAVAPIPGDSIIIELNIPNEQGSYGELRLTQVGHDYINAFGRHTVNVLKDNSTESCEVDINCPQGINWQTEKKAVCKIIIGGKYCTGTLIANAAYKKIPYLITAFHCLHTENIEDSIVAAATVFFFNYERPFCGATESTAAQTLSGSLVMSTTVNQLDFALLKLNDFPPISYNPYFVGWDKSGIAPDNGVTIHHPNGAGKKISIDDFPLITGSFGEGYDDNSHWKISQWSVGATEGGSSGGPFFNTQHRLVGTLTGGQATCATPVNDYFEKFSLAWDKYPDSAMQVKYWLDPQHTGVSYIDGYDPYGFSMTNCDTSWNLNQSELTQLLPGKTGSSWLTGSSSSGFTKIAEKFYSPGSLKLLGAFFNIAKIKASNALSAIELKVWQGDLFPTEEVYSKPFILKNLQADAINFMGFDSLLKVTGNFFIGYTLTNVQPSDIFAIKESQNRGINGPSTMYVFDGVWNNINAVTSPEQFTSLAIGITECYGKTTGLKSVNPIVYPNPCVDYLNYDIPVGVTVDRFICYNTAGSEVPLSYQSPGEGTVKIHFNLPTGVYILKVITGSGPIVIKFVVIH